MKLLSHISEAIKYEISNLSSWCGLNKYVFHARSSSTQRVHRAGASIHINRDKSLSMPKSKFCVLDILTSNDSVTSLIVLKLFNYNFNHQSSFAHKIIFIFNFDWLCTKRLIKIYRVFSAVLSRSSFKWRLRSTAL